MAEKSRKIQNWLSIILIAVAVVLLITTYKAWFVPSPLISFNLALLTLGLFGLHVYRKEGNRKKEVLLLLATLSYVNLIISGFIYSIWSYEAIFTKKGITQMSIFVFLLVSLYLTIAYVRARITYKQVKGNQRHNEAWHVSKKDLQRMQNSDDIYINLGLYHEGNKD